MTRAGLAVGLACLLLSTALAGCAITEPKKLKAYSANTPEMDVEDVTKHSKRQRDVVAQLALLDGEQNASGYRPLVDAGILYVDERCERYMDALFWFDRVKNATNRQIGYVGSVSAAVLEILDASSELVSLAPLGFKLATETVDSVGKGLLYDLSPATVRGLVAEQQGTYKKALDGATYQSRAAALQAVYGYLSICLPVSIETRVAGAVARAKFEEKPAAAPAKPAGVDGAAAAGADGKPVVGAAGVGSPAVDPKLDKVPVLQQVGQ